MLKVLIFDWGRTLYDPDSGTVFPDVPDLLRRLQKKYQLAVVCLATDGDFERRMRVMAETDIEKLFSIILMAKENKDELYEQALEKLGCEASELLIVDDRIVRGIRWGNRHGAQTVWLRRGKFSSELSTPDTGEPHHVISNIAELEALV